MFKENKSIKISSFKLALNNDNNKEKKLNLTVMYKLLQKYWKTIILFKMCSVNYIFNRNRQFYILRVLLISNFDDFGRVDLGHNSFQITLPMSQFKN